MEVSWPSGGALPRSKSAVWSNGLIPGDNVVGNNNVLETVKLGYFSAAETLATDNQNGVVVFGQSGHGRM
jgi:hypothetical protein